MLGEDYVKKPLYEVFDELGKNGWEPHVFFHEDNTPVWVMRKVAKPSAAQWAARVHKNTPKRSGMIRIAQQHRQNWVDSKNSNGY